MQFNPDLKNKIFSKKAESNNLLNFTEHINTKISKCNKLKGIIKKLSISFPTNALLRIYKSFIRPHLDYADIIYDKPNNVSFKNKIENVQYRALYSLL